MKIKCTKKQSQIMHYIEYDLENNKTRCFNKSARYQLRDNKYFEGYYKAYYENLSQYQTLLIIMIDKSNEYQSPEKRDKYITERLSDIGMNTFSFKLPGEKKITCKENKGRDYRIGYERGTINSYKHINKNIEYFLKNKTTPL